MEKAGGAPIGLEMPLVPTATDYPNDDLEGVELESDNDELVFTGNPEDLVQADAMDMEALEFLRRSFIEWPDVNHALFERYREEAKKLYAKCTYRCEGDYTVPPGTKKFVVKGNLVVEGKFYCGLETDIIVKGDIYLPQGIHFDGNLLPWGKVWVGCHQGMKASPGSRQEAEALEQKAEELLHYPMYPRRFPEFRVASWGALCAWRSCGLMEYTPNPGKPIHVDTSYKGNLVVHGDLCSEDGVTIEVKGDCVVEGELKNKGELKVGGTLIVNGEVIQTARQFFELEMCNARIKADRYYQAKKQEVMRAKL